MPSYRLAVLPSLERPLPILDDVLAGIFDEEGGVQAVAVEVEDGDVVEIVR